MKINIFIIILLSAIVFSSCDKGLAPVEQKINQGPSYLKGKITYLGGIPKWPSDTSAFPPKDIRIVAFKTYPPSKDIFTEISTGNAYFSDPLLKFVDSDSFTLKIPNPPVLIKYLVLAQNHGDLLQWRPIGFYKLKNTDTIPAIISVASGDTVWGLNITVDWENLPKMPF